MKDRIQSPVLEASLSDPSDPVEVTMIGTAVSAGITDTLRGTNKRIKWTGEQLQKYASTLKDMPITLQFDPDDPDRVSKDHTNTIIGRIKDVFYDSAKQSVGYTAQLYKHYFPETIQRLVDLRAADGDEDDKPQTSWEFLPTGLEASPDDGDDVFTPTGGRFGGLAVIARGADKGSRIALLAAAAEREQEEMENETIAAPKPGSFEWIGNKVAEWLTVNASVDDFKPAKVLETYPDHVIYTSGTNYYTLPYTITDNTLNFSDTIEVEPVYQPLGASAAGSIEITTEAAPPTEETHKNVTDIDEKELEALRASAAAAEKVPTLEQENNDLKAEVETLKAAQEELDALKAANAEKEEAERLTTLAASRLEEVEKIVPYKDATQKEEDREAFKTMDDASFAMIKRALMAAAEVRGGVASEDPITPPETREDGDGAAAAILQSEEFAALKASYGASKEDK
jgi:hypothetical protein